MKPETLQTIQRCLKFKGGRSRPDKSFPFIIALLSTLDGGIILDVGCGRGSAGLIIKSEFGNKFVMHGIDVHDDYLKTAMQSKSYVYLERIDLREYFQSDHECGVYLFVDVLEHLHKYEAVAICADLRKAGARIIAAIPNASKHWKQSPEFEAANPHEAHLHDWTNAEVERDLGLRFVGENDGVGVFAHGF